MTDKEREQILGYAAVCRYYVGRSEEDDFVECVRFILKELGYTRQSSYKDARGVIPFDDEVPEDVIARLRGSQPEPQEQSRSVQRRIAAQKGEPAPDFSKKSELPADKLEVETVAKWLFANRRRLPDQLFYYDWYGELEACPSTVEKYLQLAREVLKLFPEYEPAELEALSINQIVDWARKEGYASWDCIGTQAAEIGSQATCQKNQTKGQLFRVKE